jgi:signal transduction histidine kinase
MDSVIRAAIEQIAPKADSKQIQIRYCPESCTARFDSKWTQEALFNLLDNAVKYSSESAAITVTIKVFEMFACISVADQGIGIPDEELPCIFGRFYRGQNVREQNGVGIGLYLCRKIIEGQGGYITAESTVNQGSIFKIFLPR